jgi:SAM-dependent methyltransferase
VTLRLPPDSVRGTIRAWIQQHVADLRGPVLEVGTAGKPYWWTELRDMRPDLRWIGLDQEDGQRVDMVANIERMPEVPDRIFASIVCAEVLEHVWDPKAALRELHRVCVPGGVALVTTLFSFPYHPFPDDYWRFSRTCLRRLMVDAGFLDVEVVEAGVSEITLYDHDDTPARRELSRHVFARGRA